MDLQGFTTVDEVGEEDAQVRNHEESFKPATAAEEIDYINKILADIERGDGTDNNNGRKRPELKIGVNSNNSKEKPVTDDVDVCEGNSLSEKDNDCSGQKHTVINDQLSKNWSDVGTRNDSFICKELPSHVDNILTQAHKPQVNLSTGTGIVASELSSESNLCLVNTSIPLPDNRLEVGVDQNTLGEGLETHTIRSLSLAVLQKGENSGLNYCSDAISVPIDCSTEGSSVLESGHYSARELQNSCLSGQDISGLDIDSSEQETTEVSASNNIVLGDINSLLTDATEDGSVGTEETTTKEVLNLALVKTEPVDADPGEDFALEAYFDDPAEEFRVKEEQKIKEEPQDCSSPPSATMDQEPTLFPVKIFKSENEIDNDNEALTSLRYIVEENRQYSREQLSAALIISQSSLAPAIDMSMFNNLGKTSLEVKLSDLEEVVNNPAELVLEDSRVVSLFVEKYGKSSSEWKKVFPAPKKRGRKKQQSKGTVPDTGKRKRGRPKKVIQTCDVKSDTDADQERPKHDVPPHTLDNESSVSDKIQIQAEYSGQRDSLPNSVKKVKHKPGKPKKVVTQVVKDEEAGCKMELQIHLNKNEFKDRKKMEEIEHVSALTPGPHLKKVQGVEKRKPGRPRKNDKHNAKVLKSKNNCESGCQVADNSIPKHFTPVSQNDDFKGDFVNEIRDESLIFMKSERGFDGFSEINGSSSVEKLHSFKRKGKGKRRKDLLPNYLQTVKLKAEDNEAISMTNKLDIVSPGENDVKSKKVVFDTKSAKNWTGKSVKEMDTTGRRTLSNHQSSADDGRVGGALKQNCNSVDCAEIKMIETHMERESNSEAKCTGKAVSQISITPINTCCRPCSVYILDIAKDKKYKKLVKRQLKKLMKKIEGSQIKKLLVDTQSTASKGATFKETSSGQEQVLMHMDINQETCSKNDDQEVTANTTTDVTVESSKVIGGKNNEIMKEEEESYEVPIDESHSILKTGNESTEILVKNILKKEESPQVMGDDSTFRQKLSAEVSIKKSSSLNEDVTDDTVGKQDINEEVGMMAAQADSSHDRDASDSDSSDEDLGSFGIGLALAYLKGKNENKNTVNESEVSRKLKENIRSLEETEQKTTKQENSKGKEVLLNPGLERRKSTTEDQGAYPVDKSITVPASHQSRSSLSSFRIPKKTSCNKSNSYKREESPVIKKRDSNMVSKKNSGYVSDRHKEIENRDSICKDKKDTVCKKSRDHAPLSYQAEGWRARVNSSDPRCANHQGYRGRDFTQRPYSHQLSSQSFASEPYDHNMHNAQNCSSTGNTYKGNMPGMYGTSEPYLKPVPVGSGPYSSSTRLMPNTNIAMCSSPRLSHEDSTIHGVIGSTSCYQESFVSKQQKTPTVDTEYSMKQMDPVWSSSIPPPPVIENWNIGVPSSNLTGTGKALSISSQSPVPSIGSVSDTGKETINSTVTEGHGETVMPIAVEILQTKNTEIAPSKEDVCIEKQAVKPEKEKQETREKDKLHDCGDKFHYSHMSRRERFKLYEKRKRYYNIAKMKFMEEKDKNKRKVRFIEYDKRRNEYNHLKCYLLEESQKRKRIQSQGIEHTSDEVSSRENIGEVDHKVSNKEIVKRNHSAMPKDDDTVLAHPEALGNDDDDDEEEEGNDDDVPYSPSGSPLLLDEDFPELNVRGTLLGSTVTSGNSNFNLVNPSSSGIPDDTEQMRELVMSVLDTLKSCKSATSVESGPQDSSLSTSKSNAEKSASSLENETGSLPQSSEVSAPPFASSSPEVLQVASSSPRLPTVAASPALPSGTIPSSAPVIPSPLGPSLVPVPSPFPPELTSSQPSNQQPSFSPKLGNIPPSEPSLVVPLLSSAVNISATVSAAENSTICPKDTSKIPLGLRLEWEKDLESIINPKCLGPPKPQANHLAFVPPFPLEEKPPLPPEEKPPLLPQENVREQDLNMAVVDNVMEVPMELDSDDEMAADVNSEKQGNKDMNAGIVHPCELGNKEMGVDIMHPLNQRSNFMPSDKKLPDRLRNDSTGADVHPDNLRDGTIGAGVHFDIQGTKDFSVRLPPDDQGNDTFLASFGIDTEMSSVVESHTTKCHDGRSDLKDIISRLMGKKKHYYDTDIQQNTYINNQNVSGNLEPKVQGVTGILSAVGFKSVSVNDSAAPAVKGDDKANPIVKRTPDTSLQNHTPKLIKVDNPVVLKPNKDDGTDIEIIESKEPRKLFCIDELLQSVEAADQPGELEVVYADIRRHSSEVKTRDEVPKYYQKIPLAQTLVDKCKDLPLLGLQYVLEVRQMADMTLDTCYYICVICSKKMSSNTLVAHVKSVPHRLKFSEIHCSDIYEKFGKYNLKQWTATLVKDFTKAMIEVEAKMGRHRLAVGYEKDMSSVLAAIKQKINEITELRCSNEKRNLGKEAVSSKLSSNGNALPAEPVTKPVSIGKSPLNLGEVPLPSSAPPPKRIPVASQGADVAKPSEKTDQTSSVHQKGTGEKTANANDEVIVIPSPKGENDGQFSKSDSHGSKFQKRNYRARSHSENKSPTPTPTTTPSSPRKKKSPLASQQKSRSPTHRRSHSPASSSRKRRTKSPSNRKSSPPSKRAKHGRRSPSPASRKRKRHSLSRSRSRSRGPRGNRHRSRSRSLHRRSSRSRRTPDEESEEVRARRKLREFRDAEARLKKRHANLQKDFEKDPESHPKYRREWKSFWERRSQELQNKGLDPLHYDFKPEWAAFWHHRMKFLVDEDFKVRRDDVLRKLKLEDPDLLGKDVVPGQSGNESRKFDGQDRDVISRIDRSPSPWEGDEGRKAKNPSPPKEVLADKSLPETNSSSLAKIYEEQFSVIGTLKLLNELEDQLGSFGPAMATLLDKAIECSQKGGDSIELFKDPDNMVLVRYAREKLSSQISAGILGAAAFLQTQMAVERAMWLQSQAEKINEGKYLGLDIASIAKETLGKDTVQIANFIAQHLLRIGKSDASEEDLQNILFAVSAAHTKMIVEQATKSAQNTVTNAAGSVPPVQCSSTSNSPAAVAGPSEPPQPQVSRGSKPLFPASASSFKVPADSVDSEKEESKEDGPTVSGLSLLQNAYEDHTVDMDKLSIEDLKSLLANFRSLSNEEQEALTKYLKKLEATDSKKVMKLREEMQKTSKNANAVSKARTMTNSKPSPTLGKNVAGPSPKIAMQWSGKEKGLSESCDVGRDGTPAPNQSVNVKTNIQASEFSANVEPSGEQKPPPAVNPNEMQCGTYPVLEQAGTYMENNLPNSETLPQERERQGYPDQRNLPEYRPDPSRTEFHHGDHDERTNKQEGCNDAEGYGKPRDDMQDYGNPRDDQRRGEFQGFGDPGDDERLSEFQRFGNPSDDQRRNEFQGFGKHIDGDRGAEFQRFGNLRSSERRGEFERFGNPRDDERRGDWQGFGNTRFDDRRDDWQGYGNPRFDDRRHDWQGSGSPMDDNRRNLYGPEFNRPGPQPHQAQFMSHPTNENQYDPQYNMNEPRRPPHMGTDSSFRGRPGMMPPGAYQPFRGSW